MGEKVRDLLSFCSPPPLFLSHSLEEIILEEIGVRERKSKRERVSEEREKERERV